MAISLKHAFQSTKNDGPDDTLIQPQAHWNAEHVLNLLTGKVIGRYSAGAGPAQELTPANGIRINGSGQLETYQIPSASLDQSYRDMDDVRVSDKLQVGGTDTEHFGSRALSIYKSGDAAAIVTARFQSAVGGPVHVLMKSRHGTPGSFSAVQENDVLGDYLVWADNGASYSNPAFRLRVSATQLWNSTNNGTKATFSLPNYNGAALVDRFTMGMEAGGEFRYTFDGNMYGVVTANVTTRIRVGTDVALTDGSVVDPLLGVHGGTASVGVVRWGASQTGGILTVGHVRNATVGGALTAIESGDFLGEVGFSGTGGGGMAVGARIVAQAAANWTGTNRSTDLLFQTTNNANSRITVFRITNEHKNLFEEDFIVSPGKFGRWGNINNDDTLTSNGVTSGRAGLLTGDGRIQLAYDVVGAAPLAINKTVTAANGNDFVDFFRAGSRIGGITTGDSGTDNVLYQAFCGAHWSQFHFAGTAPPIKPGTIVSTVNAVASYKAVEWVADDGTAKREDYFGGAAVGQTVTIYGKDAMVVADSFGKHLAKFKISNEEADKAVYGVFSNWYDDGDACVLSVGAAYIRIRSGETVAPGDLIESDGTGCGRKQADDVIRSSTVGKVTANIPIETYDDGSYIVPAVLYCG